MQRRRFIAYAVLAHYCLFAAMAVAAPYAHPMPDSAPDYGWGPIRPYDKRELSLNIDQSEIYYAASVANYGPTTAGGEASGICDETAIETSHTSKYNLACTALYALFSLNANYSGEFIDTQSQSFKTCCQGAGCTVSKKYIYESWAYVQRGYVVQGKVKINGSGELSISGDWSDWADVNPCQRAYCVLKTRAVLGFSSSSANDLSNTYDPALRSGSPACP